MSSRSSLSLILFGDRNRMLLISQYSPSCSQVPLSIATLPFVSSTALGAHSSTFKTQVPVAVSRRVAPVTSSQLASAWRGHRAKPSCALRRVWKALVAPREEHRERLLQLALPPRPLPLSLPPSLSLSLSHSRGLALHSCARPRGPSLPPQIPPPP